MTDRTFTFTVDMDQFVASMREAQEEIDQFAEDTQQAGDALDETGKSADETGKSAEEAGKKTAKAGGDMKAGFKVAAVAAAAAAAAVAGVVKAVLDFAEATNQIAKRAKEVGTSAEEYQKLQGVLDLMTRGGVDASIVIQTLQRNIDEAAQGNVEYAKSFQRLNIDLDELRAATPTDQLVMFAEGLKNVEDRAARSAIQMELLGRGGKLLGPAFDEGGAAIRANAQKIEDAGLISNEVAAQSEALADAALLLGNTFDALRADVLAPLIPRLQETAENIQAIILEAKESGQLEELGTALSDLFSDDLLGAIEGITQAIVTAGNAIDTFRNVLAVLSIAEAPLDFFHDMARAVYTLDFGFENLTDTARGFSAALRDLLGMQKSAKQLARDFAESGGGGGGGEDPDAGPSASKKFKFKPFEKREDKKTEIVKAGAKDREKVVKEEVKAEEAARDKAIEAERARQDMITDYHQRSQDAQLEATLVSLEAIGEAYDEMVEEAVAAAEEAAKRQADIADGVLDLIVSVSNTISAFAWRVADEKIEAAEDGSRAEKEAAVEAFRVAQAVAVVSAGISTALAMIEGLAAGLSVGGPAGIALGIATMAFAATAGGIAIGEIASESPPSFHSGGMVDGTGATDIPALLRGNEAILSPQGVTAAGGADGVDALNRGQSSGGGSQVVVLKLNTRTIQAMEHESLRTGTGPLNEKIRTLRSHTLGHYLPQGHGA